MKLDQLLFEITFNEIVNISGDAFQILLFMGRIIRGHWGMLCRLIQTLRGGGASIYAPFSKQESFNPFKENCGEAKLNLWDKQNEKTAHLLRFQSTARCLGCKIMQLLWRVTLIILWWIQFHCSTSKWTNFHERASKWLKWFWLVSLRSHKI